MVYTSLFSTVLFSFFLFFFWKKHKQDNIIMQVFLSCFSELGYWVCLLLSHIWLFVTIWMDFSPPGSSVHGILQARIWSGLPFPLPGDHLDPGIKLMSLALTGRFLTTKQPWKPPHWNSYDCLFDVAIIFLSTFSLASTVVGFIS